MERSRVQFGKEGHFFVIKAVLFLVGVVAMCICLIMLTRGIEQGVARIVTIAAIVVVSLVLAIVSAIGCLCTSPFLDERFSGKKDLLVSLAKSLYPVVVGFFYPVVGLLVIFWTIKNRDELRKDLLNALGEFDEGNFT